MTIYLKLNDPGVLRIYF